MVDEPFVLPDYADRLTSSERGIILVVIQQMLAKRELDKNPTAPVIDLRHYKTRHEGKP